MNCQWHKDESNYYILITGCSYSSIDHIKIQIQYLLQVFDFVYFEQVTKVNKVSTTHTSLALYVRNLTWPPGTYYLLRHTNSGVILYKGIQQTLFLFVKSISLEWGKKLYYDTTNAL